MRRASLKPIASFVVLGVLVAAVISGVLWIVREPTRIASNLAVAVIQGDDARLRDAGIPSDFASSMRWEYLHGRTASGLAPHTSIAHVYSLWPISLGFDTQFGSTEGDRPGSIMVNTTYIDGRWRVDAYGFETD
jgi:hypothetical protein